MFLSVFVFTRVAYYLGENSYGIFSYNISILILLSPFLNLGVNQVFKKKILLNPSYETLYIQSIILLKLILSLGIFGVFLFIFNGKGSESSQYYYLRFFLLLSFIFRSFDVVEHWLDSNLNSRISSSIKSSSFIVTSIFYLLAVHFELRLVFFGMIFTFEFFLSSLFYFLLIKSNLFKNFKFKSSLKIINSVLYESYPLLLCDIFIIAQTRLSNFFLNHYWTPEVVANFNVALKFSEVWCFIPASLSLSMFAPLITESKETIKNSVRQRVIPLYSLLFVICLGIFLSALFGASHLFDFLFHNSYQSSYQILIILLASNFFIFWGFVQEPLDLSEDLLKFRIFRTGIGLFINVLFNFWLIPDWGGKGAAVSILISYSFTYCFSNLFYKKTRKIFYWQMNSILFWKSL